MKKVTRLYDSIQPSNYNLTLSIDPDKMTFSGRVIIKAKKVGRPSKRITLHQKDLKVLAVKLIKHSKTGDKEFVVDRINNQNKFDELRIHSPEQLFAGDYTIEIDYIGKITDPMNGLYPCYFTDDGKEKKLFATQFESHHAREVFPGVDEPESKATYDLTLITPNDGEIIANTPIEKLEVNKNIRTVTFETTPIMSSYLLAFAYGDVGYLETKTNKGTTIRTYATPKNVQFTDFALDTAKKCLEFYEDFFGIDYPLEKLDMIALPDFSSGAMENWGLVTYREQVMLVDPKNTSLSVKQYVAMVVAHELAHQWFGNLVTMKWWTDLWLNEGFASWIEYLAVDKLFPEWNMWEQFIASEQQPALKLDALDNTHPIEVLINHPDEIRTIFDGISYGKGASVIHMLYGYLGETDFRNGLRAYLKKHAYGNTITDDLWTALEKSSGKPVKEFMHSWTSLPGFPVVIVKGDKNKIKLHQERYFLTKPASHKLSKWPVPILDSKINSSIFKDATHEYSIKSFGKLNLGQSGFYRTAYDHKLLSGLLEIFDEFEAVDRLGLLADSFETSKAFYGSTVDSLILLSNYSRENSLPVWEIIASNIGDIRRVMDDEEIRENLKPVMQKLARPQFERLGWQENKNDSHFDTLLRPLILGLLSASDDAEIVNDCLSKFNAAKNLGDLPANFKGLILSTSARNGNQKTYDKLIKFLDSTENSEEKVTLASALSSFKQPEIIKEVLGLITSDKVRRQDSMYWLAYCLMNRYGRELAWDWMKNNWNWLEKELGSDLSFYRTPIYAAKSFSSKEFLKEYIDFFEPKSSPALERSIKQGKEMLIWQISWREKELKPIKDYLNKDTN